MSLGSTVQLTRVYVNTLDKCGTELDTTPEGWVWVQVDAEPGVNHKHLAGEEELEDE
jgi:hypothetical protein